MDIAGTIFSTLSTTVRALTSLAPESVALVLGTVTVLVAALVLVTGYRSHHR